MFSHPTLQTCQTEAPIGSVLLEPGVCAKRQNGKECGFHPTGSEKLLKGAKPGATLGLFLGHRSGMAPHKAPSGIQAPYEPTLPSLRPCPCRRTQSTR